MRCAILVPILLLAGPGLADPDEPKQAVPRVVVEPVEVGNPNKAFRTLMARVIRVKRAGIDSCVQRFPGSEGELLLGFTVEPKGTLSTVRALEPGDLSPCLVACVVEQIGSLRVPAPRGGGSQHVRYPLRLPVAGKQVDAGLPPILDLSAEDGGAGHLGLPVVRVRAVIKSQLKRLQRCYENDLRPGPALRTRLWVRFSVGSDGEVRCAEITRRADASQELEDCVLEAIRTWRFPKPWGAHPVVISLPMVFAVP